MLRFRAGEGEETGAQAMNRPFQPGVFINFHTGHKDNPWRVDPRWAAEDGIDWAVGLARQAKARMPSATQITCHKPDGNRTLGFYMLPQDRTAPHAARMGELVDRLRDVGFDEVGVYAGFSTTPWRTPASYSEGLMLSYPWLRDFDYMVYDDAVHDDAIGAAIRLYHAWPHAGKWCAVEPWAQREPGVALLNESIAARLPMVASSRLAWQYFNRTPELAPQDDWPGLTVWFGSHRIAAGWGQNFNPWDVEQARRWITAGMNPWVKADAPAGFLEAVESAVNGPALPGDEDR
jgi:hypothetical protein